MTCRKLLSAVLALCMVLGSMTAFAAEIPEATYDCSAITFSYGTEAASALQGGKTLTANVSVSKTGGEQNLTFAMFLYKNNKPVDADISTKAVDSEKVDFSVSIDTPSDISGCSVVVFMWDSLKTMKAICNSALFPEGSTKLSYLSVDGAPLKGFSPDVYEYTYEVESERVDAPVITAKTFDGSAVATIVAPTDFPGKTVVKVSHPGGASSEYVVRYKASGITQFVTDLTNCYDNKLPEEFGGGDVTHKAQYLPESLKVGEVCYLQRNYTIATVNDDRILGKDRIIQSYSLTHENNGGSPNDVKTFQSTDVYPWINFTLLRGATVRVLLCVNTQSSKLTSIGFTEEVSTNANGFFNVMVGSANRAHKYMYSKHFNAGERVVIPNVGEGNNSVYSVVVDYDPFGYVPDEDEPVVPDTPVVPDEPEDVSLELKSISVDGANVAGFKAETKEYTVDLSIDQAKSLNAPAVTYELADEESSAVVTEPAEFPGKATITVTNKENETSTYTINYSVEKALGITTNVDGKTLTYVQNGLKSEGAVASDRDPSKTWYISEINYAPFKDNSLIFGGVNASVGVSEFTFNLPRAATVSVIYNTAAPWASIEPSTKILNSMGFAYDNDESYYKIVVSNRANSTQRWYRMTYYKNMEAGEYTLPYCVPEMPQLVAIKYLSWGQSEFETEEPTPDTPAEPEVNPLELKSLKIDGVEVADFDAATNEYTVNLTKAQASAKDYPVVSYELADSKSTAVVTNPTTYPGKATVTVTDSEGENNTYTVNYSVEGIIGNITTDVEGKTLTYVQDGLKIDGGLASDRDPSKLWYISEVNYEPIKGNSTIYGGVTASEGVTEFTMNLPRAATVTAMFNTSGVWTKIEPVAKVLDEMGFEYENDESYYKIVVSNRVNEQHRYYRMIYYKNIEAGEITLPYCVPEMPQLVAIKYLPWGQDAFEEEPEEPEISPLALKSLEIDGVAIDGFDADTMEYTVALTDAQLAKKDAPEVTYELQDEASSATVTMPETFPGKATVTVTNGVDSRTYTITYAEGDMIKDMYVLNESNTIPAAYTGTGSDYTIGGNNVPKYVRKGLVEQTEKLPIYTDRNGFRHFHDTTLIGNDIILTPVAWSQVAVFLNSFGGTEVLDWLNFTVKRDAVVKVFTGGDPKNSNLTDYGFVKQAGGLINTNCCMTSNAYFCHVINGTLDRCQNQMYTKAFKAGDKVVVPNFTFSDYSYTVAIEYPGWGEEYTVIPEAKATLSNIKVNGAAIPGFDSETFEYEAEFDAATLEMPEVTFTAKKGATATLENPTTFPGEATITVSEEGEENVYTIKYVPSVDFISDIALCEAAGVNSTHSVFPKVVSTIAVGDKFYTDRGYLLETINETGIENADRIMTAVGWRWDVQNYGTLFNGSLIKDWMSFKLNRGAYVTVYDDTGLDSKLFEGYNTEAAPTGSPYMVVRLNASRTVDFTTKYTRYFPAGSVVKLPNASNGESYSVVVSYAPWDFEEPEVEPLPEFAISYSDLVPKVLKGEDANVTIGNWYGFVSESYMTRKFSKEFDLPEGNETQTITVNVNGFTNQNAAFIVAPLDENASKDVIVNADGSEIEWGTFDQATVDYDYEGAGEGGFNKDYATFAQFAKNVTPFSGGDAYVYRNMVSSDDRYISGSAVVYTRNLLCGGVAWPEIPEEFVGCNYIVPMDSKLNGGEYTFEITVNAPVKIVAFTSVAAATMSDDISDTAWTVEPASFKKRHMNVVDNLTVAYLIKKGYLDEADIGAYSTINNTHGYRIRRFDVLSILEDECGVNNGWAIDPAKKEATGFVGTINDYTYDQYLAAWVDEE